MGSAPSGEDTVLGTLAADPEPGSEASAASASSRSRRGPAGPRKGGESVGRYILLDPLGAGAMGVVWAAYDPELDRRVALKLLRWAGGSRALRLQREAQALARLTHPNVVAVFDVGEDRGETWLAMELVEGQTLRDWLGHSRPWAQVLTVLEAAGAGVVAAHAAGLVHRDLKPANIMLGQDGRARVMDFGLARAGEEEEPAQLVRVDELEVSRSSVLSSELTHAGALLGTPAYMAPELFAGGEADEQSDLFAFCVLAWEALYGERPFAGDSVGELSLAIVSGAIRQPSGGKRVPRWLRQILVRGLQGEGDQRWSSMAELLAALRRGRARVGWWRAAAVVAGLGAAVAAGLGMVELERRGTREACEVRGAELADMWSERRGALEAGVSASELSFARESLTKLGPWLERWSADWGRTAVEVCVANELEDSLDDELRARADACLSIQRAGVEQLLERIEQGDRIALTKAVAGLSRVPPPAHCGDAERLRAGSWPAPEQLAPVEGLRARLARAWMLSSAGAFDDAREVGELLVIEAQTLGWAPLIAEVDALIGAVEAHEKNLTPADVALRRAYLGALSSGNDSLAASVAGRQTLLVGKQLGRIEEGRLWAELARVALERGGEQRSAQAVERLRLLAVVERSVGEHTRARELVAEAQEIALEVFGSEQHPGWISLIELEAVLRKDEGDYAGALELQAQCLATLEQVLGSEHPGVARVLNDQALTLGRMQRTAEARPLYERAMAIWQAIHGEQSPQVATALNNLMMVYGQLGMDDEAMDAGKRSLAIREATLPEGNPRISSSLNNLALLHFERGELEEALALNQRALELRERAYGPKHPQVARSLTNLGEVMISLGDASEAVPMLERALTIRQELEVEPLTLAYTQKALARAYLSVGEAARAEPLARAAIVELEGHDEVEYQRAKEILAAVSDHERE